MNAISYNTIGKTYKVYNGKLIKKALWLLKIKALTEGLKPTLQLIKTIG